MVMVVVVMVGAYTSIYLCLPYRLVLICLQLDVYSVYA